MDFCLELRGKMHFIKKKKLLWKVVCSYIKDVRHHANPPPHNICYLTALLMYSKH